MEMRTISQVSRSFGVSTRTLRYYEQVGLLSSLKKDGYAYRVYEDSEIIRLQQIIILRKLRMPLKQITEVLKDQDAVTVINIFMENIKELDNEIHALSIIKSILSELVEELKKSYNSKWKLDLFTNESLLDIINSLSLTKIKFKEEKSMDDLNKANQSLSKLQDRDVRILYLPPATVASIHKIGGTPEDDATDLVNKFIKEKELYRIKPDFRLYGFNHPNGEKSDGSDHGYEFWITIPDDMEITPPYTKKKFEGGIYASHMIPIGAFDEWQWICEWTMNNDKYEPNWGDPECMGGLIEEHLNYINLFNLTREERSRIMQLDLLVPVVEKNSTK